MTLEEAQKQVDQWVKTYGVRYFSEYHQEKSEGHGSDLIESRNHQIKMEETLRCRRL